MEVGFLGDAGSGKSYALLLKAARYLMHADYRAIIFRKSYPDLEMLIDLGRKIYGPMGGKFNKNEHKFVFPSGAQIFLSYISCIEDAWNYQGRDFAFIGFDEVTHIPIEAYLYLFSRLRSPNSEIVKQICCTANPDGKYVLPYYERFIRKLQPVEVKFFIGEGADERETTPEAGNSRVWVQSERSQNTVLMENDPDYEKRLESLPEEKRNALKYGLWVFNDDPLALIKTSWINKARTGQNQFKHGHYSIGFDFAHMGDDKTVLTLGSGNRVLRIQSWGQTEHTEAAEIIAKEMHPYGYQVNCGLDSAGTGAGVYSILRDKKYSRIFEQVIPLASKDRSFDEVMKIKYDNRIKFLNVRSQVYWRLREDFERGDIDLTPLAGTKQLTMLLQELAEIRWNDDKGYVQIEDKAAIRKRLKRSPDYADSLAYWNWVRHLPIALPHVDVDEEQYRRIDYGRYADDTNFSDSEPDRYGDIEGDIGSWA